MSTSVANGRTSRLGDFVRIRTGKLDANASSPDGEYPFFTCSQEPLRIASFTYDCECVLVAGNGDLNVKYYQGKFDAYQRTYIIESADKQGLDVRYLFHFMSVYVEQLRAMSVGGVIQYIKLGFLTEAKIPLPPLAEQQRIAEVLDRAEALRAKRRAALAQLDSLTQSLFLDLFGDVAKNDRNWSSDRMEDLMKIRRGGSPRPIENYLGGDINWIKIGDGTHGSDIYLEHCADKITKDGLKKTVFLKAGSLIFANCGVSLGFARILKLDGCIHDGWLSFEEIPETRLDKMFLLKALNSITEHFRRIAPAGTQPNLNTGLMKNFRMILPPITMQREFARRVTAVEALKTAQRASLAELDALFATLQHRAFKGDL